VSQRKKKEKPQRKKDLITSKGERKLENAKPPETAIFGKLILECKGSAGATNWFKS